MVREVGLREHRAVLLVVPLVHPVGLWAGRPELLEALRVVLLEERPLVDRFVAVPMAALWVEHLSVVLPRRFVLVALRLDLQELQVVLLGVRRGDLWAARLVDLEGPCLRVLEHLVGHEEGLRVVLMELGLLVVLLVELHQVVVLRRLQEVGLWQAIQADRMKGVDRVVVDLLEHLRLLQLKKQTKYIK